MPGPGLRRPEAPRWDCPDLPVRRGLGRIRQDPVGRPLPSNNPPSPRVPLTGAGPGNVPGRPVFRVRGTGAVLKYPIPKEEIAKMKLVKDDNNSLTLAQVEFCNELEASDRSGQALWLPAVASGYPTPDCLVAIEEVGRFAVTLLADGWSIEDDRWHRGEDGAAEPVDDPLEAAWQSAKGVRMELKRQLDIGSYVIPVVVFTDMEPDPAIMEAAQGRSVRVFWNTRDAVARLASLPGEHEVQEHLRGRYIAQEMEVLRRRAQRPEPAREAGALEIGDGRMVIQHVDVVNVYVGEVPPNRLGS